MYGFFIFFFFKNLKVKIKSNRQDLKEKKKLFLFLEDKKDLKKNCRHIDTRKIRIL